MKAHQRREVRRKSVVALVGELIAIVDLLISVGITPAIVQNRPAGDGLAIGAGDGHQIAQAVAIGIENAAALLRPLVILLALAGRAVAQHVVKGRRGLVVDRGR